MCIDGRKFDISDVYDVKNVSTVSTILYWLHEKVNAPWRVPVSTMQRSQCYLMMTSSLTIPFQCEKSLR
ncbi:Hypothetical predicted protein [Cloeon dipterum]|uniref:Uncharacterized protein n=1 Tax=Cloeon dipterum TaxID=197152 RepID=A0A8S1C6M4_9INSE|nr:Hypothetical predicted protein [Cloeon dipterum]